MANDQQHLLGQIDGKLDQVIKSLDRHIDDDVRRFSELYKKTSDHDQEIAKAHGAKGVILWAAAALASVVAFAVPYIAKALGLK